MGSTFDCADHSNSVCFFVRSTNSWPVMAWSEIAVVIGRNPFATSSTELFRQSRFLFGNVSEARFKHIHRFIHLRIGNYQRHEQPYDIAVGARRDSHQTMLV